MKGVVVLIVGLVIVQGMMVIGAAGKCSGMESGTNDSKSIIYVDDNNTAGPWDGTLEHPYQHIQDGVNNASNGDTVYVFSGSYHEKVNINKAHILLLGEDQSTTFINHSGNFTFDYVVTLSSTYDVLSHFTITLTSGHSNAVGFRKATYSNVSSCIIHAFWGMALDTANNNRVYNNKFITIANGLEIFNSSQFNELKNNFFTNAGYSEFINFAVCLDLGVSKNIIDNNTFEDCHDTAIESVESHDNIIEHNLIEQNRSRTQNGIFMGWISNPPHTGNIIRNNIIHNCSDCGIATEIGGHTITGNLIEDGGYGLSIHDGPGRTLIQDNIIRNCEVGQDLWYAKYPTTLKGNLYDHCGEGIEIWDCKMVPFHKNTFSNDTTAVILLSEPGSMIALNRFYNNNFMNNKKDIFNLFSRNIWLHNYWGQPLNHPKAIYGILPFIQFDWLPARKPN